MVVDLKAAISRFVAEANDDAKPFAWLADPNNNIIAVRRGLNVIDPLAFRFRFFVIIRRARHRHQLDTHAKR